MFHLQQQAIHPVVQYPWHNVPQVSHPAPQPHQNATSQGSQAFGACFKCELPGYMAKNCPNRQPNQGANQQQRSQGQQNCTYGKVNHVTAEEAQQSQDVVLRIFLTNSHPKTVLFDSGASHSFIASKFVAKHNLPITIMKYTMIVSSLGGEMKTKHICLAISIAIRGCRTFVEPHHHRFPGHRYNS
jgi:hypothetical protein